jgi:hypothetical protein
MVVSKKGCTRVAAVAASRRSMPCLLLLLALALIIHTMSPSLPPSNKSGGAMENKKTMGLAITIVMCILSPYSLSYFFHFKTNSPDQPLVICGQSFMKAIMWSL